MSKKPDVSYVVFFVVDQSEVEQLFKMDFNNNFLFSYANFLHCIENFGKKRLIISKNNFVTSREEKKKLKLRLNLSEIIISSKLKKIATACLERLSIKTVGGEESIDSQVQGNLANYYCNYNK